MLLLVVNCVESSVETAADLKIIQNPPIEPISKMGIVSFAEEAYKSNKKFSPKNLDIELSRLERHVWMLDSFSFNDLNRKIDEWLVRQPKNSFLYYLKALLFITAGQRSDTMADTMLFLKAGQQFGETFLAMSPDHPENLVLSILLDSSYNRIDLSSPESWNRYPYHNWRVDLLRMLALGSQWDTRHLTSFYESLLLHKHSGKNLITDIYTIVLEHKLKQEHPKIYINFMQKYASKGHRAIRTKTLALKMFREIQSRVVYISQHMPHPTVHILQSILYFHSDEYVKALASLDSYLEIDKSSDYLKVYKFHLLAFYLNTPKKAIAYFEMIRGEVKSEYFNILIQYRIVLLHLKNGRAKDALALSYTLFKQVEDKDTFILHLKEMFLSYERSNLLIKFLTTIKEEYGSYTLYLTLSELHFKKSSNRLGERFLHNAIILAPEQPEQPPKN